jgi:conjugative transfer signal peptidase TraF
MIKRVTLSRAVVSFTVLPLILSTPLLMRHYRLHFNWTESEPRGLYRETNAPLTRGQYVLISPWPPEVVRLVVVQHHGQLPSVVDPRNLPPLLKHIAALPGDHVTVSAEGVTINGRLWPRSKPQALDHAGRPLTHWPFGEYTVAPGRLWLLSDNARGLDSRYFGPVALSLINATVSPVLTE